MMAAGVGGAGACGLTRAARGVRLTEILVSRMIWIAVTWLSSFSFWLTFSELADWRSLFSSGMMCCPPVS